jgi:RHS repeat-associated protein
LGSTTTTVSTNANGDITGFSPGYGTASVTSLSFNNANRLTSVSASSGTLGSYVYDARGYRFSKAVGSTTTLFQYSPTGTLLEESTGGTATDYIYLNGRPIAMLTGTTFTYLHGNNLGSPKVATNASQTVLWRLTTLPYGETLVTSGTSPTNLRFPGQYYDAETGFNHNVNRDYAPGLGRYLESDSIGVAGGLNTYLYVQARPMNFSDPLGLFANTDSQPDLWNAFLNGDKGIPGFGPILENNLNILASIYNFGMRGAVWAGEQVIEDLSAPVESISGGDTGGTSDPNVIVIGEDMENRVIPTAQDNNAGYYNPPADLPPDQWMQSNQDWINQKMDEGCTILDCGAAPGRPNFPDPTSPYYQMEQQQIQQRNYPNYQKIPATGE